ncbi:hypothetical protein CYFUS_009137 [Cystobacter fuscus]|uniref:GON domain-containing protein n=1 Tax=Cystobacter fuscus TaxID=43 RepID=A0A250JJJ6_9BACT|nr:GON domain-containing protein [Cystobacter fuscus]ATB43657.1 hypothetical protein CYFUS_009137 [Cystobacter fuscus]
MMISIHENSTRRYLAVTVLAGGLVLGACGPSNEQQGQKEEEVLDEVGIQAMALTADSCARLKAVGQPMERNYTLFVNGDLRKPFIAWCDADGDTYLNLPTGGGRNFSQYLEVDGTSVSTRWAKVRLDPVAMTLDVNDARFTTSTGSIPGWNKYYAAYGEAGDCVTYDSSTGRANVDLRGLPFAVSATWKTDGWYAAGGSTRSSHDQVVDVSGGGYCGSTTVDGALTVRYVGYDSCATVAAAGGTLNQDYTLYLGLDPSKPYLAYCHSSGNTYLTLRAIGSGSNFSQYLEVDGTSVSTRWAKVRLDPVAMTLDVNDARFATSTGSIPGWNKYYAAYGEAGDCVTYDSSTGRANVDLRGLPFAVSATWKTDGWYAAGGSTRSSHDQVVDVSGGGYCGSTTVDGALTVRYFYQ